MKLLKIIFLLIMVLFAFSFLVAEENNDGDGVLKESKIKDGTIPRSVLIVPFYNMTPRKTEFDFLSDALRDAITSRLQNLDQFYFVNPIEVTNSMSSLGFNPASMNNINNALRLASHLKADILVVGKFYILEEKVMISTRSYDMIDFQDVVSSVEGNTGVDIFVLVDALSSDMARKMEEKYPKLEEFKSSNDLFANNYSGVKIGDDYTKLKNLISNSKFPKVFYPSKRMMFIRGQISDAYKTNLIALYFDKNNKLSNIFIDALLVKQELRKINSTDQKNRMIRMFGDNYKSLGDDNFLWEGLENSFELINRYTHQGKVRYFYHFFNNSDKVDYETFEKDINFFKEDGFEVSVGGGLSTLFSAKIAKTLLFKDGQDFKDKMNLSFPIKFGFFVPFSFTYVFNRSSLGFNFSVGYTPGFMYKYYFTSPSYYIGTFNFSLSLRMKFVDKKNIYIKNLIEFGAIMEADWVYDRAGVDEKYYLLNPDAKGIKEIRSDSYIGVGPVFRAGREYRYGNFTFEPLFVIGATFGAERFEHEGEIYERGKVENLDMYKMLDIEPNPPYFFTANIFIGHEIRFNFYKVIKK